MSETTHYDEEFYKDQRNGSLGSARRIVPLLVDLLRPSSVLDVGCGTGTWLSVFGEAGVTDLQGIDGGYVRQEQLLIDPSRFREHDLRTPFDLGRQFDLVISLEVAEHLPPENADAFVRTLTQHGSMVLFSAAIPAQGGTNHLNEQWQHVWARRFEAAGFVAVDCIRRQVWFDPQVESFYAQNILLYARPTVLEARPALAAHRVHGPLEAVSVVHPAMWGLANHPDRLVVSQLAKLLMRNGSRSLRYRLARLAARVRGQRMTQADEGYLCRARF